jgi:hypothetical protein
MRNEAFFNVYHDPGMKAPTRKRKDRLQNLAGIRQPIFGAPGDCHSQAHRHDLEFIFDNKFPQWDTISDGMIMQARELSKSVPYNWRRNWLPNHCWRSWIYWVNNHAPDDLYP